MTDTAALARRLSALENLTQELAAELHELRAHTLDVTDAPIRRRAAPANTPAATAPHAPA